MHTPPARRKRLLSTLTGCALSAAGPTALTILVGSAGCQSARVGDPLTHSVGGNDPDQQMEFLHRLADRKVTSNDDGFHGLLMFLDGNDPAADYPARVAALRRRNMLPGGFDQPADHALERGTLSVALVRALSIKGGLTMLVLGPSPRYATRELQYLDIYPVSSPNQTIKGSEFLSILSRAEDYQRSNGTFKEPGVPTGVPQTPPQPNAQQPVSRGDDADGAGRGTGAFPVDALTPGQSRRV